MMMERLFQRVAAAALFAAALFIGLPAGAKCKEGQYEVKRGDQLSTIVKEQLGKNVSLREVEELNDGLIRDKLTPGQCLTMPKKGFWLPPQQQEPIPPANEGGNGNSSQETKAIVEQFSGDISTAGAQSIQAVNQSGLAEQHAYRAEKTADLALHGHLFFGFAGWLAISVPNTGVVLGFELGQPNGERGMFSRLSAMVGGASPTRGISEVSDTLNPGLGVASALTVGYRWGNGLDVAILGRLGNQLDEDFTIRALYFAGGAEAGWFYRDWVRVAVSILVVETGRINPDKTTLPDSGGPPHKLGHPGAGGGLTLTWELPGF